MSVNLHKPAHRANGAVGSFTIHSPADYRPRHAAVPRFVAMPTLPSCECGGLHCDCDCIPRRLFCDGEAC